MSFEASVLLNVEARDSRILQENPLVEYFHRSHCSVAQG